MIKNIQHTTGINMTFLNTIKVKLIGILNEIVDPVIYAIGNNTYKLSVVTDNCAVELDIFTDDSDFTDTCGFVKPSVVSFEWQYSCNECSYTRSTGKMYLCDSKCFNENSLHNIEPSEFYHKLMEPLLKLIYG